MLAEIIVGIAILGGPLVAALLVCLYRARVRRAVHSRGYIDLEAGDVADHLQGPAFGRRGRLRRSVTQAQEEARGSLGKPY